MDSALTYISIGIPESDVSFMEQMAQRMGWKLQVRGSSDSQRGSIATSLKEANEGKTKRFNSVSDLMKDLLE